MPRAEATFQVVVDLVLEGLLIALLVFAPLAFGAVHAWSQALVQAALVVAATLWLVRLIWTRPPSRRAQVPSADPGTFTLAGYRFVRTGLGLPVILLLAVVMAQMIPVPSSVARVVSPGAGQVFGRALPGYAEGRTVDFSMFEPWLTGRDTGQIAEWASLPSSQVQPPPASSGRRPLSIHPHRTALGWMTLAAALLAFLVALHTMRSRHQIERLSWIVILVGLGLAVMSVVQRIAGMGPLYGFYPVPEGASPVGPFLSGRAFAAYMVMALPLTLGMLAWWLARLRAPVWSAVPAGEGRLAGLLSQGEPIARIGLSGFTSLAMLGALMTPVSRGAILSLATSALLYGGACMIAGGYGRRGMALARAAALTAGAVTLLLLGAWQPDRSVHEAEPEPAWTLASMAGGWKATLDVSAAYPFLGAGLGTYGDLRLGAPSLLPDPDGLSRLLLETGPAGLILALWGCAGLVRRHVLAGLVAHGEPRGLPGEAALRHGMAVGLLAIVILSWWDDGLRTPAVGLLAAVLAALLVADNVVQADT
ncbi:MAG: hypothetical protein ACREAA_09305 [Candidatus Polarisedimenticolia bacterium]